MANGDLWFYYALLALVVGGGMLMVLYEIRRRWRLWNYISQDSDTENPELKLKRYELDILKKRDSEEEKG